MKYETFLEKVSHFPFFGDEIFSSFGEASESLTLQLTRWVKSAKLIRLKRGIYTLPEQRRKTPFSLPWLANNLYSPSYVSLEFALSFYGMIPERVSVLTSVTRLKTAQFENPLGRFTYRHLKEDLFFGFEEVLDEYGKRMLIASPEKALLDLLYLTKNWAPSLSYFEDSLRLQQLGQLRKGKLLAFAKRFSSKKILQSVNILLEMIHS